MSSEQYHANRMFGKRPEIRVGFKEHMKGLWQDCGQAIAVSIVWLVICINYYNAGKEDAREKIFRQLNRLQEDPQLLHDYIRDGGY
jgi:hypothetical protein